MGLSPFSQTQTSGGVYSGVSVMLGSRLSLDRLAEWIKWQAWAVQSSLWVDGALAMPNKLKSNLPGQSGHALPVRHQPLRDTGGQLSLLPGLRVATRVTEIARREASVEPSHETVDVVDRNPELIAQRARIGHHVRTLKQDGSDASVLLHELAARIDDVSLGGGNVHGELVVDHHARELAPAIGSHHGHGRVDADRGQMLGSQCGGIDGEDADLLAPRQCDLNHRHLHQARGGDGHGDRSGELLLVK